MAQGVIRAERHVHMSLDHAGHYGVKNGDRVEIYRPLELDPRELRRNLAAAGRTMRSSQESDDDQSPGSSV